mmetsp:Transcript_40129/g.94450  ORF Transcript_40129/g.94450 Transcript_40129/m.94450 type:complete len:321 (-) Transcript_40129:467-1429(-)
MRLLQDDADCGGIRRHASQGAVHLLIPLIVLLLVLKDCGRQWVPDALVRNDHRVHDGLDVNLASALHGGRVATSDTSQHRLQVLRRSAQPVLERQHKAAGIGCLVTWQELQDLWQGAHQSQQTVLEGTAGGLGLARLQLLVAHVLDLLCEVAKGATSDSGQVKGSNLVHLHHIRHGWEAQAGIEAVTHRVHNLHKLVSELLHKDERADEDVGCLHVSLQLLHCLRVADLLKQVAHALCAEGTLALVDLLHRRCHARLVLGLEDNVHDLNQLATLALLLSGDHSALRLVRCSVATEATAASEADNLCGGSLVCIRRILAVI